MTSPVVDLTHFPGRRPVVVEELGDRLIQRLRQDEGLFVLECVPQ
ncbi:MAG: hypothetical protein H6Q79_2232, partial [Deltaproteobacteria bacterium]|nr:hypothetical protein [Deltaproteobacteria bacterium]